MKGKKFLSLGMAAVLACSAFPATSYAMETDAEVYEETDIIGDEEEGGGSSEGLREGDFSYYKLEEGGVVVTHYYGDGGNVQIPATIAGEPVKTLHKTFSLCANVTGVTIPDSVTSIEGDTFLKCTNLTSVIIPDSVENIDSRAFGACGITSITIPAGVNRISNRAFLKCSKLTEIAVSPDNQTYTSEDGVLYNKEKTKLCICPDGKEGVLTIPEGVKYIPADAFGECDGLTKIEIPASLINFGIPEEDDNVGTFSGGEKLAEIVVSADNPAYASEAGILYDKNKTRLICCPVKKEGAVTVPDSVTSIAVDALFGCNDITKLVIPAGTTDLGLDEDGWLFGIGDKLTEIIVSADNPKYASEDGALYNKAKTLLIDCPRGKETLTIPASVTEIAETHGFKSCKKLTEITVSPDNQTYASEDGILYNKEKTNLIACPGGKSGETVIPASVTEIEYDAFPCLEDGTYPVQLIVTPGSYAETYAKEHELPYAYPEGEASCQHQYKTEITKAPSCTAAGEQTQTCQKCGDTKKTAVPATGHTYQTTVVQASVNKDGQIITKCTKCGDTKTVTIYAPKTIRLSKTEFTYNGKAQKPSVTVTDSAGKTIAASNYTVSYASGSKNAGTYTATVAFKGNYSGTVKKTYTIQPKGTSLSSVKAKKKGFTAKWKKQTAQTDGYEIQYSTDSKFKKGTKIKEVNKNKTTSQSISKLKAKKKYYVRIRTYKKVKVNGKSTKICSGWSKVKTVKTKK